MINASMWTKFPFLSQRRKNTFPSFRTQRSIENNIFLLSEALLHRNFSLSFSSSCRSNHFMRWRWLSYIFLDECLWMQMLWCNVMCKWMSKRVSEAILIAIISLETITHQLCIPLGTTLELLRLLLSAESALTFRCKLCIPLGTTLELLRLYFWRNQRWLFAVSSYRSKKGNYIWWPH